MTETGNYAIDPNELSRRRRVNEIIATLKETGRFSWVAQVLFGELEPENREYSLEALLKQKPSEEIEQVLAGFIEPLPSDNVTSITQPSGIDVSGLILGAIEGKFNNLDVSQDLPVGSTIWNLAGNNTNSPGVAREVLQRRTRPRSEPPTE